MISGSGSDTIYGGAGNDTIYGQRDDDEVFGDDGNDVIVSDAGSDTLYGGAGNDTLRGEGDADTLYGGAGSDVLYGGDGADVFHFASGSGEDTIADFEDGVDHIQLDGSLGITFGDAGALDDLVDQDTQSGNAIVTVSDSDKVELIGISDTDLTWDDFIET